MDADLRTPPSTINQGGASFTKEPSSPLVSESQVITVLRDERRNHVGSSRPSINSRISEGQKIPHYQHDVRYRSELAFKRMKDQILRDGKKFHQWRQRFNHERREKEGLETELNRRQTALHASRKLVADLESGIRKLTNDKTELEHQIVNLNIECEENRNTVAQQDEILQKQRQRNIELEDRVMGLETKHTDDQRLAELSQQQNIDYLVSQIGVLENNLGQAKDQLAIRDANIADQEKTIANFRGQARHLSAQLEDFQAQVRHQEQRIAMHMEKIDQLAQDLDNAETDVTHTKAQKQQLEENLTQQKAQVVELQDVIAEQKQFIDERRTADFASVAADVSCELPDGEIRSKFGELLGTELDDWCMDYKIYKMTTNTKAVRDLYGRFYKDGILWSHGGLPYNIRFTKHTPKAQVILLQAALANFLCKHFLQDRFFLLKMNHREGETDGESAPLQAEYTALNSFLTKCESETAALQWQATTAGIIQSRFTLSEAMAGDVAKIFVKDNQLLLRPPSLAMLDELSVLILNFAQFCLRLSTREVPVYVCSDGEIGGQPFKANSRRWDLSPLVGLERGDQSLDGRPMCVIIKPMIFTKSAARGSRRIVWSKASVWVSNESAGTHPHNN
ncbi:hypothetical protein MCOR07_001760 [Pyricularia oryzae]|nr:hypothetical protein MCOR01_001472 [Pyricularia oryzae]KAI6262461.1 hypothetical protein MCOR19_001337 [Pyricularia oryzae]KAI6437219.1 hypothetical protein MCOR21_000683 [Pyricularia oryzae]KAI6461229.1 hypothetical protein MCOR15_005081 [Pyricularia oryzae]KAI6465320.1 hypothetical protein MCOR17_005096 [Pyricularia oryzae]